MQRCEFVVESGTTGFLLDQSKWSTLDEEQRYALTKLLDPGKRNKRMRALAEFFRRIKQPATNGLAV